MRVGPLLPFALAFLGTGCFTSEAINRRYDLGKVRRIGVLAFDYGRYEPLGVEDIFVKYLLERGYTVIERARLEAILREQKLGAAGVFSPETAKDIGRVLGVDALLLGQVTAYQPERKSVVVVETRATIEEPVFETKKRKQPDGSTIEVREQVGTRARRETKRIPQLFPVDAEVGLAVKLVDVQTGEVIWAGSDTGLGTNGPLAVESIAYSFVKNLSKKWRRAGS